MYTNQMCDDGFSNIIFDDSHLAKDYERKQCDLNKKWISEPPTKDGEYLVLYIDDLAHYGFDICNPVMLTENNKYRMTICKFKNGVWELKANIVGWKENE